MQTNIEIHLPNYEIPQLLLRCCVTNLINADSQHKCAHVLEQQRFLERLIRYVYLVVAVAHSSVRKFLRAKPC